MLALMLLGLVVQPMIAAACDVHDVAHVLATGHCHDGPEHDDRSPDEAPSDPWVDVIHLGHCCAHMSTITATVAGWSMAPSASAPPGHIGHRHEPPVLAAQLRPPIG